MLLKDLASGALHAGNRSPFFRPLLPHKHHLGIQTLTVGLTPLSIAGVVLYIDNKE
jgi:hypothetical protein